MTRLEPPAFDEWAGANGIEVEEPAAVS